MEKKLAITGATGLKSGGAFIDEIMLHRAEIDTMFPDGIVALVRPSSKTEKLKNEAPYIYIYTGEFTDPEFLKDALSGVDTCVHIAGIGKSREIVQSAAECGVRRLILVHTTGIYSKYKAAGEEYRQIDEFVYKTCKEHNILLTILRPTMIYGNCSDQNVIKFIRMVDKFPIMPIVNGANYELQPVHYEDLAKAYYEVLIHEKETVGKDFDLSGGAPIMLRDMLTEIGKNLGKKVRYISVPFPIAYAGGCAVYALSFGKIDYREKIQRLCEPRVYSHEPATEAFGYAPRNFEQGIVKEVEEYKKNRTG